MFENSSHKPTDLRKVKTKTCQLSEWICTGQGIKLSHPLVMLSVVFFVLYHLLLQIQNSFTALLLCLIF